MRPIALFAVIASLVMSNINASAADRTIPFLSLQDLQAGEQSGSNQGASTGSSGAVLFPEQILGVDVSDAGGGGLDPRIAAWAKTYRFLVVPLNVAVQANPGSAPRYVKVNASFRGTAVPRQAMIVDIFPATGFKAEAFQGSASLGIGADLKFDASAQPAPGTSAAAGANATMKAALSYTYAPAFANVQTGFAASTCFWQFAATQSEQPVGSLPLKVTVGIPREMAATSIGLALDIVANFGSTWWGDEVRARVDAEVLLPP